MLNTVYEEASNVHKDDLYKKTIYSQFNKTFDYAGELKLRPDPIQTKHLKTQKMNENPEIKVISV